MLPKVPLTTLPMHRNLRTTTEAGGCLRRHACLHLVFTPLYTPLFYITRMPRQRAPGSELPHECLKDAAGLKADVLVCPENECTRPSLQLLLGRAAPKHRVQGVGCCCPVLRRQVQQAELLLGCTGGDVGQVREHPQHHFTVRVLQQREQVLRGLYKKKSSMSEYLPAPRRQQ